MHGIDVRVPSKFSS